jgi:outer membrane biosynthesis protein TonB
MKKAMLTTTILVGTLLSGAGVAVAAPPFAGPTDIAAPTATTEPEPEPCEVRHICDITLPTLDELPTDIANPTENPDPTDPTVPTGPTDIANPTENPDPTDPPETGQPPVTTTTQQPPVEQPKNPPSGVPTPNRIDTGAGPADPVNWWLIALPVLALLGLAATGTWLVIQRSERRPS